MLSTASKAARAFCSERWVWGSHLSEAGGEGRKQDREAPEGRSLGSGHNRLRILAVFVGKSLNLSGPLTGACEKHMV